jgi:hypothetical protein
VGASGVVTGAPATGITDGQFIMGVATMDIANNGFGYVNHFGVVRGFRTNGASVGETWNDGDILWYNPSYAGGLTNVQPAAPTPEIIVCVVITASNGNNGSVLVRPTFMPRLDQLTGVDITSPTTGEVLKYDGTNWINGTASGGGAINGIFYENDQTINTSYTIPSTKNAMSTGSLVVASGVTVTVASGARWVII